MMVVIFIPKKIAEIPGQFFDIEEAEAENREEEKRGWQRGTFRASFLSSHLLQVVVY